jgi:cytoskeletal protein RodZ
MRNFLYNKSDILVAAAIVVVAIIIIWSRIDVIMSSDKTTDKPSTKATTEGSSANGEVEAANTDDNTVQPPANTAGTSAAQTEQPNATGTSTQTETQTEQPAQTETPAPGTNVKFKVKSGMASGEIADALIEAGLITSVKQFNKALKAQDADTKLRAGTFKIPAGSTPAEIVSILLG